MLKLIERGKVDEDMRQPLSDEDQGRVIEARASSARSRVPPVSLALTPLASVRLHANAPPPMDGRSSPRPRLRPLDLRDRP